ncbi:MAG: helix-turn-helix domain-containing protein [Verrucomicrobiales bacterium]|nr:helix-turn-helix domain-containing protein [Verrucomicrobiales bacterium]
MTAERETDWFPDARYPEGTRVLNGRCLLRTQDRHCVVLVCGIVLAQFSSADGLAAAHAMVSLVEQGWATQSEVAQAFGCTVRTVRRHQRRFEGGGLASLARANGFPRGRARVPEERQRLVEQFRAEGVPQREIARRIGVSETAIRKLLRRLGWRPVAPIQPELGLEAPPGANPNLSAFSVVAPAPATPPTSPTANPNLSASVNSTPPPPAPSVDQDPGNRRGDRLLARLGLLEDAAPLFGSASRVSRAGVLLAVPALVGSGLLEAARSVYGSLGPAFFGLRTTLLTLLFMALWRIQRPEALKEHSPSDLGRVLGLDRSPEVKTLRRKLAQLASLGKASQLGDALGRQRVEQREQALGFLYVDGHVRVYHGQHRLPKTHVTRLRLAMPATTDYWVNDADGDPLFVMTSEANAGLVKVLPRLLAELRRLLGPRRLTVVFDRGGFSPKLFQQILAAGFDLLTYRKGDSRRVPQRMFHRRWLSREGRRCSYVLADQEVRLLRGRVRLRQVTRLTDTGHQTPILTSRRDLPAAHIAHRMFERWRQENFFKYLREEFALDALAEHAVVADDPNREVPNPGWTKLDAELRRAHAGWERLQAEYGLEAFANLEQRCRTMRGFRMAHGRLARRIEEAWRQVERLQALRDQVPRRVPVHAVRPEPVVKLAPELQHLVNLVKMVAYQAESDLYRALEPHYRRNAEEGRTLLHATFASAADLHVTATELQITLARQSAPHRSKAMAALCEELNRTETCFPGTSLRLRYAVQGVPIP